MAGLWYRAGTVTVTTGSAKVTGFGSVWKSGANKPDKGHTFWGPDGKHYELDYVESDTVLYLVKPYAGPTASGQSYEIDTTRTSTIPALSREVSALLAYAQEQYDSWQSVLTGSGDIELMAPDGQKVTIPALSNMLSKSGSLSGLMHPDVALGNIGISEFMIGLIKLADASLARNKLDVYNKSEVGSSFITLNGDSVIAGVKAFRDKIQLLEGASIVNKTGELMLRPSGSSGNDTVVANKNGFVYLYALDSKAYVENQDNIQSRLFHEMFPPTAAQVNAYDKAHTVTLDTYDYCIDDIRTNGFYRLSNSATGGTKPEGLSTYQGCVLVSHEWDSNAGSQTLYPYNTKRFYWRTRQGSSWTGWRGSWNTEDFNFSTGNFTPTIVVENIGTMSTAGNFGKYTRVGNLVTVSGVAYFNDTSQKWPQRIIIGGMPFGGISTGYGSSSPAAITPFNMSCGGHICGTYGGWGGGIDMQIIPTGQALRNLLVSDLSYVGPDKPFIEFQFSYFVPISS